MVALLRTTFAGRTIVLMAVVVGLCSLALGMVMNSAG
jgi:hypothetical protein